MKKELTKEWNQLHADTMAFLENLGERITKVNPKLYCGISIRNHEKGYTLRYDICSYNKEGVRYFESKYERKTVKWDKVREWDLYYFIKDVFKKNKEALSLCKRYDNLCTATRETFETYTEENGDKRYRTALKLSFIAEERPMKLYRTGSWGVMLKDKNGEEYEDDFTGLDMASRCKLVEYLSA